MQNVLTIFGTRPEAIKMAPVISELREAFKVSVCVTGQHNSMLKQVMRVFEIVADYELSIMTDNQKLSELTGRAILEVEKVLVEVKPDIVLVQGDTTTALSAAMASFYNHIIVGHVEAGLRTHNRYSPFPEETNRHLISSLAEIHFAPTIGAKNNLLNEGICGNKIHVTGNTVVDALRISGKKSRSITFSAELCELIPFLTDKRIKKPRIVLVTGHRREHFGAIIESICTAIATIAKNNSDVAVIYPVHLNPNVQEPVHRILGQIDNVYLTDPLDYLTFVKLLSLCTLVLTDSGGIQEEAPSLGKPVLVMRNDTERTEGIDAGISRLVGTDPHEIVDSVGQLLNSQEDYDSMSFTQNPYGDGFASKRIKTILQTVST